MPKRVKDLQFQELQIIQLHVSRLFLDARMLRGAADARYRFGDVYGRQEAGGEQCLVEIDLAVGDGDEIGGDVAGDIAFLGLDDGQGGKGAAARLGAEAGGPLQQAGVQIKDVSGIGLAAGWAAQ